MVTAPVVPADSSWTVFLRWDKIARIPHGPGLSSTGRSSSILSHALLGVFMQSRLLLCLAIFFALVFFPRLATVVSAQAAEGAARGKATAIPGVLDETPFGALPEVFQEKTPRNESDTNHRDLTTLLTTARLMEHRGDVAGSLQTYQRAHRLSPRSTSILQEIVRLGFLLDRNEVATRYAVLLAENKPDMSADALQRIAQHLLEDAQTSRAVELYERSLTQLKAEKGPSSQQLGIRFRLLGLYHNGGQQKEAARHAAQIVPMLANPEKHDLESIIREFTVEGLRATYEQLGKVYLDAGQVDQAEQMFAQSQQMKPVPALAMLHAAEVAVARGNDSEAIAQLDAYLAGEHREAGVAPYELLLRVVGKSADSTDAARRKVIERLAPLHQKSPAYVPLAYFLAGLYADEKNWDGVIETAGPLIDEVPEAEPLRHLVEAYVAQEDWPGLVPVLATSLDEQFDLTSVEPPLKELLADKARWKSLQQHLPLDEAEQFSLNERIAVARLWQLDKQGETAWKWAQAAMKDQDSQEQARLLMQFAVKAYADDQEAVAEDVLRVAIRLSLPKNQTSMFYFYLATVLEAQGKTDEALRIAKRAALLDEGSALLRSRIPWTLYHAGRADEAAQEYRNLLEKFGGNYASDQTRQVIGEAKRILSSLAGKQGNYDEAVEWLEQVLDEFPGDIGASNDLGYLWVDQGKNLGRGLNMIQAAVAAEPENWAYLDSLGWAYFRLGRNQDAIDQLEKAVALADTPDPTILDHLGDAYHAAGQKEKARQTWQKAAQQLKNADESDLLSKVEEKLRGPA